MRWRINALMFIVTIHCNYLSRCKCGYSVVKVSASLQVSYTNTTNEYDITNITSLYLGWFKNDTNIVYRTTCVYIFVNLTLHCTQTVDSYSLFTQQNSFHAKDNGQ